MVNLKFHCGICTMSSDLFEKKFEEQLFETIFIQKSFCVIKNMIWTSEDILEEKRIGIRKHSVALILSLTRLFILSLCVSVSSLRGRC